MPHKKAKLLENIQHVLDLAHVDGSYPSPIDLNIHSKVDIELPELEWNHYEQTAHKMKVTNSGQTVVLSAKWKENKPFITSGPLPDKYIFSQMHFHWGSNDNEGSEHTIEGFCFPMEMHVVHFKASYSTRKIAHEKKDGLVVTVYLFQIQENDNRNLSPLIDALPSVCDSYSSTSLMPSSLKDYAPPFSNNYFLYWGSVNTVACSHEILWFVCRDPVGISRNQLHYFRQLKAPDDQPVANTFKGVHSLQNRSLFLVNGASPLDKTLRPMHLVQSAQVIRSDTGAHSQTADTDFWPFINIVNCTNLQSPIDILSQKAIERTFAPLTFTDLWVKGGQAYIKNEGHTVAVTLKGRSPLLEGGPLRGSYKFMQVHFHWSNDDHAGSEHRVDGMSYSMESHAVHIHVKCEDMNQALTSENGIAVVANFLKVSKDDNKDFSVISDDLKKVVQTNSESKISADCFRWLQNNTENGYFTYAGSLTTPSTSKTVTWIVFPNPIHISHSQVTSFRHLKNEEGHSIDHNCRPIQKLNDRTIYFAI